jgi:signal transduction histidine kinase/CheY-like chemotaxis protein
MAFGGENMQPLEAGRGSTQRNEALLEAAARFAEVGVLGFAEAARQAAQHLSDLTGEGCVVALLEGGGKELRPLAACHADPGTHARLLEQFCGPLGHVYSPHAAALQGFTVRSMKGPYALLSVPLANRDGVAVGLLGFLRFSPYAEGDVRASVALARAASNAWAASCRIEERTRTLEAAELKRAQQLEREREARAAMETAQRTREQMLAAVSDELRKPLDAIVAWTHVLAERAQDPALVGSAAEVIRRNAEAQARLVADLVDVSRLATGKLRLQAEELDITPVVFEALQNLGPAAWAKSIEIDTRLEWDLPRVSADRTRLRQVVSNVVENALKFTPAGGHVIVCLARHEGDVAVIVEDDGPGLAPEIASRVFEPFLALEQSSADRSSGGLGLGLALVQHLVELHGGRVKAESGGAGQGTRVTIRLPAVPGAEEAAPAPKAKALAGLRVLVVEDQVDIREPLQLALQAQGADVVWAESAEAALSVLAGGPVDAIVSDIGLPGIDGLDFMRAVRATPGLGGVGSIALTGYARPQDRLEALSAGFDLYVPKPVHLAELTLAIARVARRSDRRSDRRDGPSGRPAEPSARPAA